MEELPTNEKRLFTPLAAKPFASPCARPLSSCFDPASHSASATNGWNGFRAGQFGGRRFFGRTYCKPHHFSRVTQSQRQSTGMGATGILASVCAGAGWRAGPVCDRPPGSGMRLQTAAT